MAKSQVLFVRTPSPSAKALLERSLRDCCELIFAPQADDAVLAAMATTADVIVSQYTTPELLISASRVRLWLTPGAAIDKLDLPALLGKSVLVCNSLSHANHVAEHAIALLLSLTRKIVLHDRLLRTGIWYQPGDGCDNLSRQSDALFGATVGLVGYGSINQVVSRFLSSFSVKLLVHARRAHANVDNTSLSNLFSQSDALVIAVPLTESTRGFIGSRHFDSASKRPYIVNVSRAEVFDRAALKRAIHLRQIRGVAFDLPFDDSSRLSGMSDLAFFENAILSPHRAGTVRGEFPNLADVEFNLRAFATGAQLKNVIDPAKGY